MTRAPEQSKLIDLVNAAAPALGAAIMGHLNDALPRGSKIAVVTVILTADGLAILSPQDPLSQLGLLNRAVRQLAGGQADMRMVDVRPDSKGTPTQ